MAREIEVANDLRPEQRDDIGADGEFKSGENFFRNRGPAEHMAALQYENFLAGARQVGGIGEAIVASADDDDVVFRFASGHREISS